MQNPDWRAQRHRRGRRLCESLFSPPQAQPRSPYDGRRHPPAEGRNVRFAHLRSRWRRPVPLGTRRLEYSRKLRSKTCDSQQPRSKIARASRPPPIGWLRCRSALESWNLLCNTPLAAAFSHLATNRAHRARESPPPRAARALFTSFSGSSAGDDSLVTKNHFNPSPSPPNGLRPRALGNSSVSTLR